MMATVSAILVWLDVYQGAIIVGKGYVIHLGDTIFKPTLVNNINEPLPTNEWYTLHPLSHQLVVLSDRIQ